MAVDFSFLRPSVELFWIARLPPPYNLFVPQIIDQVCRVYATDPEGIGDLLSIGGVSSSYDAMMKRMCDLPEQPLDIPYDSPFSGGQCCASYDVTITTYVPVAGGSPSTFTLTNLPGKIRGIRSTRHPVGEGLWDGSFFLQVGGSCPGVAPAEIPLGGGQNNPGRGYAKIVNVVRADGQPDTCGDPLPRPVPPDVPPRGFPINVVVNEGDNNYQFNVELEPVSPNTNYNYQPQFNINVNDQFIVNVNMEGITFGSPSPQPLPPDPNDPNPVSPPDTFLPPRFPVGSPPGTGSGGAEPGECPDVNLQPVLNAIANLDSDLEIVGGNVELLLDCDRCARPPIGSPKLSSQFLGVFKSTEQTLPLKAAWVQLELSDIPVNAKVQFGENAPDVTYAGWFSFRSATANIPRQPVHYENALFEVPEGANGFSFTLYQAFTASVTIHAQIEEN